MDLDMLKYITAINGARYGKTLKQIQAEQMAKEYDEAYVNTITDFSVLINTENTARTVYMNKDIEPIKVLIDYQNNKNGSEMKFYAKIRSYLNQVFCGDTIYFKDPVSQREERFIVMTIPERDIDCDITYVRLMNQTLNKKGWKEPVWVHLDNSSYGTKGEVEGIYFPVFDGKVLCFAPLTEETAQIQQNDRFIFNHTPNSVYEVVDVGSTTTPHLLRIVMNKVEASIEDDFENNIGATGKKTYPVFEGRVVAKYGNELTIGKYSTNEFTIVDNEGNPSIEVWGITIDLNGNNSDHISIVSETDNSIKIKNLKGYSDKPIKVSFVKDEEAVQVEIELKDLN